MLVESQIYCMFILQIHHIYVFIIKVQLNNASMNTEKETVNMTIIYSVSYF